MKQSFKVLEVKNVFDKTQKYVKLEQENCEPVFIQIGDKNYEKIKKMTSEKKPTEMAGK